MTDSSIEVEKVGIEHVPDQLRHGSPGRTFTLWFAANLTIADYVIGVLSTAIWGFTLSQALPILLVGNVAGGILLGLAASMGPSLGYPQMLSSRGSFGKLGNYLPAGLNWISTVGWFTINTILAVIALQVVFPGANFVAAAAGYVLIQTLIAVYGHDFIHLFEKGMSIILGLLFLFIFALTVPDLGKAVSYVPSNAVGLTLGSVGLLLVASFSYLMSWSPYASDYSRYLPASTSKTRVVLFALAGGAAASFAIEGVGAVVGSLTATQTLKGSVFSGLYFYAGQFGPIAMLTLILGAFAADALNLYTNSLSALVLDVKASRWKTVAAGGVVGFLIAVVVGSAFEPFYENFLLALSYWITPWVG
ncbi:MAG TPA: cytosine permease, partial [Nitrososphaerales archaeon]|nr:cytosine permease [Nitrososphaerales archaeon]